MAAPGTGRQDRAMGVAILTFLLAMLLPETGSGLQDLVVPLHAESLGFSAAMVGGKGTSTLWRLRRGMPRPASYYPARRANPLLRRRGLDGGENNAHVRTCRNCLGSGLAHDYGGSPTPAERRSRPQDSVSFAYQWRQARTCPNPLHACSHDHLDRQTAHRRGRPVQDRLLKLHCGPHRAVELQRSIGIHRGIVKCGGMLRPLQEQSLKSDVLVMTTDHICLSQKRAARKLVRCPL